MSESDNIKSYSASDIQKYLRGELSQADMHAMEKAALNDPFLADAIEGMEMTMNEYGDEVIGSNLSELNAAIEQKATGARVVAMRPSAWWVAAAAIVIIFSGVFVYKNYTGISVQQSAIAKGEKAKPPAQPTIGPADESTSGAISPTPLDPSVAPKHNNELALNKDDKLKSNPDGITSHFYTYEKTTVAPKILKDSTLSYSRSFSATETRQLSLPPVQLNFDTLKDKLEGKAAGTDIATVADDKSMQKKEAKKDSETMDKDMFAVSKPQARSKQEELVKNQNWSNNNFRGRVLDNNNQPIANATVSIEKERNAVTTDREGNFLINSRDSQPNASVSGVGFDSKKVELNTNIASNEIKLEPNKNALEEVVVVGYGTKRKKEVTGALSTKVQAAVPLIGWVEYEKYLEKNKKVNGEIKYNAGEVVISFIVDKKGKLSSFKIEQSLGKSEDAEALRLIKEGPAWKPTEDKKSRVTVIIRF